MTMHNNKSRDIGQDGFASIVIALIMILVMGLITIGFAQLARREQQAALNKQLANQAFYAAESGVNDVIDALPNLLALNSASPISSNTCLTPAQLGHSANVSYAGAISYTCALVELSPLDKQFTEVPEDASRSTVFSTSGPLNSIDVKWWTTSSNNTNIRTTAAGACSPTAGNCFEPSTSWNSPAVVEFSITPLGKNVVTRANLISKTFTAYLYPSADSPAGGTLHYKPATNQGPVVGGSCANSLCKVTIDQLGGTLAGEYFLIRMVPRLDDKTNITVDNARTITNASVSLPGGQVPIDVTGKAKTVLKRIKVRVPLSPFSNSDVGKKVPTPNETIEASDICKRLATYPASAFYPTGNTDYYDVDGSPANSSSSPCHP